MSIRRPWSKQKSLRTCSGSERFAMALINRGKVLRDRQGPGLAHLSLSLNSKGFLVNVLSGFELASNRAEQ